MHAYLADTLRFQPNRRAQSGTIYSWIKRRIVAWRAGVENRRELDYLRTLDSHLLADMGIDAATLGPKIPPLLRFNPHVVAINLFITSLGPRD